MENAVAFVNAFLADEFAAQKSVSFERNYDLVTDKVRKVDAYFRLASGISSGIGRPKFLPETMLNRLRNQGDRMEQRRLFVMVQHEQPDMGRLFRCVLSGGTIGANDNFAESLWLGNLGDGLQILTRLAVCVTCNSTGLHRGEKCPDCGASGWLHRGGVRIPDPGRLSEVGRFIAPVDPVQKEIYDAMGEVAPS